MSTYDADRRVALRRVRVLIDGLHPAETAQAIRDQLAAWPTPHGPEQDRTTGHSTVSDEWCARHDREIVFCRRSEREHGASTRCEPGTVPSVADPTGEAAIRPDQAAVDLRQLDKELRALHRAAAALSVLDAKYRDVYCGCTPPRTPKKGHAAVCGRCEKPLPVEPEDDRWCRSCLRDNDHAEPIDDRYKAKRLCRWCGEWAAVHDGQTPPLPILQARHRGDRITTRLVAQLAK